MYGNDPEISIMEKVPENRNSGTIFFRKTEISRTLFRNYRSLQNSGTFRNIIRKFPVSGTIGTIITLSLTYVNTTPVSNTNNIWMDAGR